MAGETIKTEAICLDIRPWSKTSHIVSWLTPHGRVATIVKGAERPKSFFLGQYDLNYTCEILYYARAKGELHALRECVPVERRDVLRDDYRSLALAGYFRRLAAELSPVGPDAEEWYESLARSLDGLLARGPSVSSFARLLTFELRVLDLLGLRPQVGSEGGTLVLRGERKIPVSSAVVAALEAPDGKNNRQALIDAARVVGVYYQFHVNCASDVRRAVLGMISKPQES